MLNNPLLRPAICHGGTVPPWGPRLTGHYKTNDLLLSEMRLPPSFLSNKKPRPVGRYLYGLVFVEFELKKKKVVEKSVDPKKKNSQWLIDGLGWWFWICYLGLPLESQAINPNRQFYHELKKHWEQKRRFCARQFPVLPWQFLKVSDKKRDSEKNPMISWGELFETILQ